MLFSSDRSQMRRYVCEVWRKQTQECQLEPLERIIAEVIAQHPEYQRLLLEADAALAQDYPPELEKTNPFLHLGLPIAIQEQLTSDRPVGMMSIYRSLCHRYGDNHGVAHQLMDCLAETCWEAQRHGTVADEARYLQRLKRLTQSS